MVLLVWGVGFVTIAVGLGQHLSAVTRLRLPDFVYVDRPCGSRPLMPVSKEFPVRLSWVGCSDGEETLGKLNGAGVTRQCTSFPKLTSDSLLCCAIARCQVLAALARCDLDGIIHAGGQPKSSESVQPRMPARTREDVQRRRLHPSRAVQVLRSQPMMNVEECLNRSCPPFVERPWSASTYAFASWLRQARGRFALMSNMTSSSSKRQRFT